MLLEKAIEVTGPRDRTVVIYNGAERQTYSCTPDCSRRLTLGGTPRLLRQDALRDHLAQCASHGCRRAVVGTNSAGFALGRHEQQQATTAIAAVKRSMIFRNTGKPLFRTMLYGIGSDVVDLIFSMAKREVTFLSGTAAISRL